MTPVTRGLQRPTRELRAGHPQTLPYLVLLRVGFSKPAMSPLPLVSSYLTFSPLPWTYHGGLVSEALSLGLPPLGITQHPALWSSDFPPAASRAAGDHLACFAIRWGKTSGCGEPLPLITILPGRGLLVNGPVSRGVGQMVFFPGHVGDGPGLKLVQGVERFPP